jgi:hypothetical protein
MADPAASAASGERFHSNGLRYCMVQSTLQPGARNDVFGEGERVKRGRLGKAVGFGMKR